jgi:thiosulfate/3-mercaptopyruvate sulfurtransferase
MLVSTSELAAHLQDPTWVVFDCRHDLVDLGAGERAFREGHIPGAFFASAETDLSGKKNGRSGRHPLPPPADFAAFLGRCGVSSASTIVAYDDIGGMYAARLWWMTRWIGLREAVVLDGGITKWRAEGRPLTQDVSTAVPKQLEPSVDPSLVWTADDVLEHLKQPEKFALIDARAPERYRGDVEPMDPVAGHIPGALNRFYKTNLNPDLTFRPAAELRREFRELVKSRPLENVGHQCGSGITGCANLFAMEYAGLRGSKLYAGSWSEWVSDAARPVARGPNP